MEDFILQDLRAIRLRERERTIASRTGVDGSIMTANMQVMFHTRIPSYHGFSLVLWCELAMGMLTLCLMCGKFDNVGWAKERVGLGAMGCDGEKFQLLRK